MSLPWPSLVKSGEPPEDDHVAAVVHQVQRGFLDALELPLEVGVHQLPDGAGAVEQLEPLGQHAIEFVNESIPAGRGHMADTCSPTVHDEPPSVPWCPQTEIGARRSRPRSICVNTSLKCMIRVTPGCENDRL